MDPPDNEPPTHHVSTFVNKETGRVTGRQPTLLGDSSELTAKEAFNRELEEYLDHLNVPTVHTCIDKVTGERTSMSTTGHSYAGGFAVTTRQTVKPDSEMDGTSQFESSTVTSLPHGIEHVFSMARRYPSANLREGQEGDVFNTVDALDGSMDVDMDSSLPSHSGANVVPHLPAIAKVHKRIPKKKQTQNKEKEPKLSEEQLLANAVRLHARRTAFLSHISSSNPYIRSHHIVTKNRTLAFVSAFFSTERDPKAVLSVLWEAKKKPHYAVVVNFTVPEGGDSIIAHCTCDYLITQEKGSHPNCFHAQVLLADELFVEQVTREIRRRQEVECLNPRTCLFGSPIELSSITETSPYLTTFLERDATKQRNIAHPWMFFLVLDTRLQLFFPLVKVYGKGMQCMGCRLSPVMGGNCSHVEACLSACRALQSGRRMFSGKGFIAELGINLNQDDLGNDSDRDSVFDDHFPGSGRDDDINAQRNQSVRDLEVYYPTTFTRRILPCPGELSCMKNLAMKLEQVPPGESIALDDRETVSCHKCGTLNTKPRYSGYKREVVLFTLAQGAPKILVYDWFCEVCREKRIFTGKTCGVFPARKKMCYTTELMYLLLEMTCTNALSFRIAYRITRLFERSPEVARRRKKYESVEPREDGLKSRRRTNEAFRAFVKHLDTSSAGITGKLFSCDNCETPLTAQDCEELDVAPETAATVKRLTAVVIDGTAAGILTKLPDYNRHLAVVPPAQGGLGSIYLLQKAKLRKTVGKFLDVWRTVLRMWKAKSNQITDDDIFEYPNISFWIRNTSEADIEGILCSNSTLNEQESQITQLYINKNTCFCPHRFRFEGHQHTAKCHNLREAFAKEVTAPQIHNIFKQLFIANQYVVPHISSTAEGLSNPPAASASGQALNVDDSNQQNAESADTQMPGSRNPSGVYVRLLLSDLKENTQFLECTISLLRFLLMEHVAMPYVGRLFERQKGPNESNSAEDRVVIGTGLEDNDQQYTRERDTQDGHDTHNSHDTQDSHDAYDEQDGHDAHDTQDGHDAHGVHVAHNGHSALVENDAQVERGENTTQDASQRRQNDEDEQQVRDGYHSGADTREENQLGYQSDQVPNVVANQATGAANRNEEDISPDGDSMMSFTTGSIAFHSQLIESMESYMSCLHFQEQGRIQIQPRECMCVKNFKAATVAINEINPVLGAFAREFLKLKRPLRIPESCFGNALLDLLRHHIEEAENFFTVLRNSLPEECEEYWRNFASPDGSFLPYHRDTGYSGERTQNENANTHTHDAQLEPTAEQRTDGAAINSTNLNLPQSDQELRSAGELGTDELKEAQETGICFPGRRSVRPSIVFKTKDAPNCSKQYKTSKTHSPGLLTVQCACDAPKLIGFVIMTQAESTALALSSILTHFVVPPRSVFYDNACNLFTSVILRVPWLLGRTRLAVDRFHYKSHKCCAYFNPDSYRQFDMQRTETAESINARIEKSLTSVRYLSGDNLMSFLRVRFALLNLSASFQQAYNRTDIEDEDLTSFFNTLVPCTCVNCLQMPNLSANNEYENVGNGNNGDVETEDVPED